MSVGLASASPARTCCCSRFAGSRCPTPALYPLRTLAAAGVIYGAASVLHGSGFLAVFVAGILVGDEPAPYKDEVERSSRRLRASPRSSCSSLSD